MSDQAITCHYLYGGDEIPAFVPNPDIAGIGVLVGFLVTAYLTFLFVVIYYLTRCVEETFTNEIDKMVLAKCSLGKYSRSVPRLELTLRRAVLMFSDQQVVTGIALLSSGYAQLKSGLGTYHWQILVYLAWFSSLTHLATLTVLRKYFRDNLAARLWRSIFMLVTVTMLGVALLPTGDTAWLTGVWLAGDDTTNIRAIPALCFFRRLVSQNPDQRYIIDFFSTYPMIISLFVLFSGYLMRLIKLSDNATDFSRSWIRAKPSHKISSLRDSALKRVARPFPKILNSHWVFAYVLLETLHLFLRAMFDIYESMLWEILWLAFSLAWGTRNLLITRAYSGEGTENTWGFGQLFPVVLLVLPLLSIAETHYEKDASPLADNESATVQDNHMRLLRVGQWGPRAASTEFTSPVPLEKHSNIRTTGTDVQTEEERLGTVFSRVSLHSYSPPEVHYTRLQTSGNVSSSKNIGPDHDTWCYEFEWVWILILMLIANVSTFIIFEIAYLPQIVAGIGYIICGVIYMLIYCFWFTAAFVALSYYHRPLGMILETYLRISPQNQHAILRTLAWICFPLLVATIIMFLLLMFGAVRVY